MKPLVAGVIETALYVGSLERSIGFYGKVFEFPVIFSEGERLRALNVSDHQVLLLFQEGASRQATVTPNGTIPPHDASGKQHLAFAIAVDQVQPWRDRLRENKIPIESEVHCGGDSIYFRDPDGHLLELITPGCWSIY